MIDQGKQLLTNMCERLPLTTPDNEFIYALSVMMSFGDDCKTDEGEKDITISDISKQNHCEPKTKTTSRQLDETTIEAGGLKQSEQ